MRLMRPFTAYQQRVNIAVFEAVREDRDARREFMLAQAATLAEIRKLERRLTSLNSGGPVSSHQTRSGESVADSSKSIGESG